MPTEISAVVIARKGSVRIKNKPTLPFGHDGNTLITHKITQLRSCSLIDRVVFGSNCPEMLESAEKAGAEIFERDNYFCDEDRCSINEAIHDMCSKIVTDVVVWAHCTNPLLSSATYDAAINFYLEKTRHGFDSLVSVAELREHLWVDTCGGGVAPFNYNPYQEKHPLAKTLPPLYMQDGGIFIQPHSSMMKNRYFFGKNPCLFCIPDVEFSDINTYRDYVAACAWYEHRQQNGVR